MGPINILSPQIGVAIMGAVAIWATTKFPVGSAFSYWLLGLAFLCCLFALAGDCLHQWMNCHCKKIKGTDEEPE